MQSNRDPPAPVHADGRSWDTTVLLRLLHRRCKEVLEVFPPETICLEDEREKYLTTLRGWRAVLGHLGDFSSLGCPTLGPCLMSGEGLAAGLGDEDIAKDLPLLDADEEKIWSRAILGVDSAELVRILELGISAGCFCHIADDDDDDYICSFYQTSSYINTVQLYELADKPFTED